MITMNPTKLLVFINLFILVKFSQHPSVTSSQNITFDFPSLTLRNLTLLGDAYIRNGVVGLTRESGVPSSSSGTVIYNSPLPFSTPNSNSSAASFSTRFSFSILNVNPSSFGDGLTFFLSPDNQILGSPGGYLGLVNSSQLTKNKFVAIEFDTRLDSYFNDPNDNHVGLDIDSLNSIETADAISCGIDFKSGDLITAWIDYKSKEKNLAVFLSYSDSKPEEPLLMVNVDLSDYLKEVMYLGFSASTEGSTEIHLIENWSFSAFGIRPVRPRNKPPHNVSDNTVVKPPPISVPADSSNRHQKKVGLALGISGPVFFCAVLVVFGYVSVKKWRGIRTEKLFKTELVTGPREFSYRELRSATKGFHSSRIVGHGAFGTVYKAFISSSGSFAAVKRSKHAHEGKTEFLAELTIIACLRHKNLLQLHGWCVEKDELLLVYEFMPNGSLDQVLYQDSKQLDCLKWDYRYNIALGLASVLTYLHQECEQQVIHRDIKTSNVMLDANFTARLGDFGLARLMDHDKSPVSTLTAGTMGYLAPEYLQYGKATDKTDVFSYGVVILEVACGRRPIERELEGQKMVNLVDWVWGLHSQGRIIEAADKRLGRDFKEEQMRRLLLLGLSCVNPDSAKRPSMRRVFQILNNEAETVVVPKTKPTLSFSSSLPWNLENIVSDEDESLSSERGFGIRID